MVNRASTEPGEPAERRWQLWYRGFFFLMPLGAVVAPLGLVPLLLVAAVLAAAGERWSGSAKPWPRPDLGLAAALAVLVSWSAIASLWSLDPAHALLLSVRIAFILAAGLVLHGILRRLDGGLREQIGYWFVAGCLAALGLLVFHIASGFRLGPTFYGAAAQGGDPAVWLNRSAVAFAILCWPAGALLWRRGARAATMVLIAGSLAVVSLLSSLSALIGMAAAAGLLLIAAVCRSAGRAILIVATILALIGSPLAGRLLYSLDWQFAGWLPYSAQHRVEIWHFTAQHIAAKPVFGWGFDAARGMGAKSTEKEASGRSPVALHPHNVALQILLELGLVGAVVALAVTLMLINRIESMAPPERAFGQATYIAALTISCTAYGAWQNWWISLLICAGLAMTLMSRPKTGTPGGDQGFA